MQDLHRTTHSTGESSVVASSMKLLSTFTISMMQYFFVTLNSMESDFCTVVSGIGIILP